MNPKETETLLDDEIPAKFRNPETGEVDMKNFVQSYKALENKMSVKPAAPKTPDEYCIDCTHGMFEADPEVNARLHELGLSNEQAQGVYDLASEKLVPMVGEIMRETKADREIEKLINHFGGPEQWRVVSRQLLAFGQQNMPADVLNSLSSSYEGVLALHRMMKSGEPTLRKEAAVPGAVGEQDLQSMMRDPRYWREKDPAFVAKVTEGFKNMYGE